MELDLHTLPVSLAWGYSRFSSPTERTDETSQIERPRAIRGGCIRRLSFLGNKQNPVTAWLHVLLALLCTINLPLYFQRSPTGTLRGSFYLPDLGRNCLSILFTAALSSSTLASTSSSLSFMLSSSIFHCLRSPL